MRRLKSLIFILLPLTCAAEQLVVEYSSFYSHTKKLQGNDTNILQFAFGFKEVQTKKLCTINSAFIHTQKQDLPITLIEQQRFTLPSDKVLKMARAVVVLELEQAANRCDMSVQLETKAEYLKHAYSKQELQMVLEQYQAFFKGMGSFLSFMMPEVQGLRLSFSNETQLLTLPGGLKLENGKLTLSSDWIARNNGLKLDIVPLRITAIVLK